jgi:soluble cytochrome b562
MKKNILLVCCVLVFAVDIIAQLPRPVPVIETEIREGNSIKMRSVELERVKRESNRLFVRDSKERSLNFEEIREDFENIQKLQSEVVRVYKTGKTVDYNRIGELSAEMNKKAVRLERNLFEKRADKTENDNDVERKQVRDLIIELDGAIGSFTNGQIFKNIKLVDTENAQKSQDQLRKIIILSGKLSIEASTQK